jgi:aspartate/methionine/tyrosine aminotransferase
MFWDGSPMGIYECLDAFQVATGKKIGDAGTRPWIQGYPVVERLPDGPDLPDTVTITDSERKYPDRWGHPALREAIARYYVELHGASVGPENVIVLGGGRQAIFSLLTLHQWKMREEGRTPRVVIEETEYTPYWDVCRFLGLPMDLVASNLSNGFRPMPQAHLAKLQESAFWIKSNPCNPTGVCWSAEDFAPIVERAKRDDFLGFVDEAYDFFVESNYRSALAAIDNINTSNLAVIGAATKGLQFPGARIGWVVGRPELIDALGSYVTFAVGGIARPSQKFVEMLLDLEHVREHRARMGEFNRSQSERYGNMLSDAGMKLHTGTGGFYHWCEAPGALTSSDIDERLRHHDASILPGVFCDNRRPPVGTPEWDAYESPLAQCFRLSFGPCGPGDAPGDAKIWAACFGEG